MNERKPFLKYGFPRAIMHVDGDAFFASVEVAKNPALKGRPVVTGEERGIATAISYEAKKYGIPRAMPIHEIRKKFPDVVVVHSDYESYALYSLRMKNIVRRLTERMEDSSIDECFAELTGLRRPLHMGYREMAEQVQKAIDEELGISVSIGLAPTKTLAKLGSKWKKPHGLTLIPGNTIHRFLRDIPVGKVCGIGPQTTSFLESRGVKTALEFADKEESWIHRELSKPYVEIWYELRGELRYDLSLGEVEKQQSISKTETFTPPSSNPQILFSELSRNIERACRKARAHKLKAQRVMCFLKTQEFMFHTGETTLTIPTNDPLTITGITRTLFQHMFRPGVRYRATGITLTHLEDEQSLQQDLFGMHTEIESHESVFRVVDQLEEAFGRYRVFLGSSLESIHRRARVEKRRVFLKGRKGGAQTLGIPMLGEVT